MPSPVSLLNHRLYNCDDSGVARRGCPAASILFLKMDIFRSWGRLRKTPEIAQICSHPMLDVSLKTLTLPKPDFGSPCNGCGYCCATEPCMLAQDFLKCTSGPCVALEVKDGRTLCGLVRNPLGYLFKAAHPDADVPLDDAPDSEAAHQLSVQLATSLGLGKGCDADDDQESRAWPPR